jgi:hypothetical protein
MFIYSDEDTDVKAIVKCWLSKLDDRYCDNIGGWIEDYFYKAMAWVLKHVS